MGMFFSSGEDLRSFMICRGLQDFELRSNMRREGFSDFIFWLSPLGFFINSNSKLRGFAASLIFE